MDFIKGLPCRRRHDCLHEIENEASAISPFSVPRSGEGELVLFFLLELSSVSRSFFYFIFFLLFSCFFFNLVLSFCLFFVVLTLYLSLSFSHFVIFSSFCFFPLSLLSLFCIFYLFPIPSLLPFPFIEGDSHFLNFVICY